VKANFFLFQDFYFLFFNKGSLSEKERKWHRNSLENDIQVQIAKIDNLELKKDIIQNIRVIQKAYSSPHPIKPKKKLIVVLATMVGLFMMLFLSFFFEYISKNKEQKLSA